MTTVSDFDPVLKYERPFDPSEGNTQKLVVYEASGTRYTSAHVRMYEGSSVEELLYTIRVFEDQADNLNMPGDTYIKNFLRVLGPGARTKWKNMIKDIGQEFDADEWDEAREAFIEH